MTASDPSERWKKLLAAVESGKQRQVLEALDGADEAERAWLYEKLCDLAQVDDTPLHERSELGKRQWFALSFAEAGTVPIDRVGDASVSMFVGGHAADDELVGVELVRQRPAEWTRAWRDGTISNQWGQVGAVLALLKGGVGEAPDRPLEPEALAQAHANILRLARDAWGKDATLQQRLSEQPWALTWPIDLLFELEGGGEASLAAVDKYLPDHASWSTTLHGLIASGALARERMIDSTLRAMASDFAAFRAGWFQRFFRGLELTDDEAVARIDALYGLLASPAPATASTVLERLSLLQRGGHLEPAGFVRSVGPCLLHKAKKTPALAIKMLAAVANAEPGLVPAVGEAVALGLSHPHTDIQAKALKLTERLADRLTPQTQERVEEAAPFLSATLTRGAEPVLNVAAFPELPPGAALPAPTMNRVPSGEHVAPIESMDELVLEAVQHLEASHELIREERLLDACLRLPAPHSDAAHHTTLRKAAERALKRSAGESFGTGHIASCQFAAVLIAWLSPDAPLEGAAEASVSADVHERRLGIRVHPGLEVLRERRSGLFERFRSRTPERLWSLPTHADGSIEAEEAKARWGDCPLPEDDSDRLILWARSCVELEPRPAAVEVPVELVVHTRGTKPYFFSHLAVVPQSVVPMPSVPGRLLASSAEAEDDGWRDTHWLPDPLHMRSAASLCIRYPEVAMSLGARAIASNLDFATARWANRHFLEPLLWPALHFGPIAHLALAVGLAAKETQERAIAIDACIESAEEGRAHAATLGAEIARLLPTRLGKPQRWNTSLTEVAAASPSHAEFVARTVVASLELEPGTKPRGIAALFELLREVNAAAGTATLTAGARVYLESFKGSSKGAKLAKTLLSGA